MRRRLGLRAVRRRQSGFTILELTLAMGIASVLASVLLAITLTYFADIMRTNQDTELHVEAHFVLQAMVEDIRLADRIDTTNELTDANQPSGGWTTNDANNWLIIGSPATNSSHDIIYDADTGNPYRNENIYFISGSKLFKRTLKNAAATGNAAATTCPAAAVTSTCHEDKTYSTHATDMGFTYYDTNNDVTTDPSLARSVRVSVTLSRKSFGKTLTVNDTILATLRNY